MKSRLRTIYCYNRNHYTGNFDTSDAHPIVQIGRPERTMGPWPWETMMADFYPQVVHSGWKTFIKYFGLMVFFLCGAMNARAVPVISALSPTRQVVTPGQTPLLAVTASGGGALTYQWYRNGLQVNGGLGVNGATSSTLSLESQIARDSGYYFVDVTDSGDNTTKRSAAIFITVAPLTTNVTAWGRNNFSQCDVPPGLTDAIAVAGGGEHSVVIKRDGTVLAWGKNTQFQTNIPFGLANVVRIASGSGGSEANHVLALKSDGTVVAWGANDYGQATVPAGLADMVAIAAGDYHSLALKSDGTVVAWGRNNIGQCTVPAGLSGVIALAAGGLHSLALKSDGTVVGWGNNDSGQSTPPAGLSGVVAITAGEWPSLALKSDGTAVPWGFTIGANPVDPNIPLKNAVQISEGGFHAIALNFVGGPGIAWGANDYGEGNFPGNLYDVIAVAAGSTHNLALRDASNDYAPFISGQPASQTVDVGSSVTLIGGAAATPTATYQWKKDGVNISGVTSSSYTIEHVALGDAGAYTFVSSNYLGSVTSNAATLTVNSLIVTTASPTRNVLVPGQNLDLNITTTGAGPLVYQWYHDNRVIPGATASGYRLVNSAFSDSGAYWVVVNNGSFTRRSKPFFVTVAPLSTKIVAWGQSELPQFQIPINQNDLIAVSTSPSGYTLGLKRDGTVIDWGDPVHGLRNQVPAGLHDVVAISAGTAVAMALKSDGTVSTWFGYSPFPDQSLYPYGTGDIVSIAAGTHHRVVLDNEGKVYSAVEMSAHGDPSEYQFPPGGLSDAVSIAVSGARSVAVKSDGTLITWGDTAQPVAPPVGLSSIAKVSMGHNHGLLLKYDGTVSAWGNSADAPGAAVPAGLSGVTAVTNGDNHSLALKSDGTVVGWGANSFGQATVPAGLVNVFAISAAGDWSVALRDTYPAPTITTQPSSQTVTVGGSVTLTTVAAGFPAPQYQWQKNGVNIAGATGANLTLNPVRRADAGTYTLIATNSAGVTTSVSAVVTVHLAPVSDFNSDNQTDILWQDSVAGERGMWIMNAGVPFAWINLPAIALDWQIVGTGDFNSDGQTDILWENVGSGDRGLWIMNGTVPMAWMNLPAIALDWRIVGTGDFNDDGHVDILWENVGSGDRGMWIMDGTVPVAWVNLPSTPLNWGIVGTGDFNGDGQIDILWENLISGDRGIWIMDSTVPIAWINLPAFALDWRIAGSGDFNGDGQIDILWEQPATGAHGIWIMNGTAPVVFTNLPSVPVNWNIAR
jgi:alpha-tubulin suppressor-like RCC1 family protein